MDGERLLGEALRAHAAGGATRPASSGPQPAAANSRSPLALGWIAVIALLAGALCGALLALLAVLAP